jgi:hypothetical protein
MEVNKDEAERCIELAERFILEGKKDKAEKFLRKAERLFPTQKAKGKPRLQHFSCCIHQNCFVTVFISRTRRLRSFCRTRYL